MLLPPAAASKLPLLLLRRREKWQFSRRRRRRKCREIRTYIIYFCSLLIIALFTTHIRHISATAGGGKKAIFPAAGGNCGFPPGTSENSYNPVHESKRRANMELGIYGGGPKMHYTPILTLFSSLQLTFRYVNVK